MVQPVSLRRAGKEGSLQQSLKRSVRKVSETLESLSLLGPRQRRVCMHAQGEDLEILVHKDQTIWETLTSQTILICSIAIPHVRSHWLFTDEKCPSSVGFCSTVLEWHFCTNFCSSLYPLSPLAPEFGALVLGGRLLWQVSRNVSPHSLGCLLGFHPMCPGCACLDTQHFSLTAAHPCPYQLHPSCCLNMSRIFPEGNKAGTGASSLRLLWHKETRAFHWDVTRKISVSDWKRPTDSLDHQGEDATAVIP